MADKFVSLNLSTGNHELKSPASTSAGAADAYRIVGLNAQGKVDATLLPTGIGAEVKELPATENLAAGDFVNIYNAAGIPSVRKADATTSGKEASGFVLSAVTSGSTATVYVAGINNQVTGMTGGSRTFLSASTAGGATTAAPSATGNVYQLLGIALSATEIAFQPGEPVVL